MARAMVQGIFAGGMPNLDVGQAMIELREAGFHVLRHAPAVLDIVAPFS
jgi:hypothetical protein